MLIGIDTYNYLHVWFTSIPIKLKPVQQYQTTGKLFTSSLSTFSGFVINCDLARLMYFEKLVFSSSCSLQLQIILFSFLLPCKTYYLQMVNVLLCARFHSQLQVAFIKLKHGYVNSLSYYEFLC